MFITRELSRTVQKSDVWSAGLAGRHDLPHWTSRNDDGALGKINTAHFSAATGREITILATSV